MSGIIDLSQLPAPACVTPVSFSAELDTLLNLYVAGMRDQLNDDTFPAPLVSDPAYQILSTVAYRLGLQRQQINEACEATMLAYAVGSDLDQIGATFAVPRLVVTAADTSVTQNIPALLESDARFRQRIQIALEAWTTAGSRGSYEYHTLTASPLVLDVYIDRPEFVAVATLDPTVIQLETVYDARLPSPIPGDVAVTVLLEQGADVAHVKALVNAALDTETVIPLTDNVHLLDAEILEYTVDAVLYCYPGPSAEPILTAARAALETYTQTHYRLGHDIAESGLHAAAHQAGVQRVALSVTGNIVVQPWQAAKCTSITVTLGGRDV
jgi:phage-related baseplate assembly protein